MAQLAHEDKMAYTEIFLKVDAESGNGDGALTMDEFEKLMIFCGHRVPKADIAVSPPRNPASYFTLDVLHDRMQSPFFKVI